MKVNKEKIYLGIDVSKETLDIYWKNTSYTLKNDASSISAFIKAEIEENLNLLCVLESTGGYERTAIRVFQEHGIPLHIAHPNRVHAFAQVMGHFAKTDKLDARLLHDYGQFIASQEDPETEILDPVSEEIFFLRRFARILEDRLHADHCRSQQMPASCSKFLKDQILFCKKQLLEIQTLLNQLIESHPKLKKKQEILLTIKGVGKKTASILIAELPELGRCSRTEISALVGVAPQTFQSGKKLAQAHIKGGRFYARKALYMAALVRIRHEPAVKQKYQKMLERGKAKKVALVALIHDLIMSMNAMVRDSKPYICS